MCSECLFFVACRSNDRGVSYTSKEKDSTGLYYYGARYYDPALMHFTQADTVIGDVYNPLSLNRYAYALNNPYKYTDPSGHVAGICIDLCISDFAIIGGFILVYAALILFEYSFIAIESLSEDMTYRTPGATEYENGLEYKTPGINEDVNINVPVDAPTIEIDDYTRLPGPTGYSYDLPIIDPNLNDLGNPLDLSKVNDQFKKLPRNENLPVSKETKYPYITPKHFKDISNIYDKGGFIDDYGDMWRFHPKSGHWDVTNRNNPREHIDVDIDGVIRHGINRDIPKHFKKRMK